MKFICIKINFTNNQEEKWYDEHQNISSVRFTVFAVLFGEEDESRVDAVRAQRLHQSWNRQEIRQSCW